VNKMAAYRPPSGPQKTLWIFSNYRIKLPVACTTFPGNAEEGRHYITNKKHILSHHGKASKMDLTDATYNKMPMTSSPVLNGFPPLPTKISFKIGHKPSKKPPIPSFLRVAQVSHTLFSTGLLNRLLKVGKLVKSRKLHDFE